MKRMYWTAAMLVVALATMVAQSGGALALQDPFPRPCGAACVTDPGCTTRCSNCSGGTALEGGDTCRWP